MLALMAVGVDPGDQVITNGFTFTALPSTIMPWRRAGPRRPRSWTMDLDDLEKKIEQFPDASVAACHMRARSATWTGSWRSARRTAITLVEDCAHSCGVTWRGKQLGYHARVTAYSTQSTRSQPGEGGFVTTDDDEIAAKIISLGCYERRYGKHAVRPADEPARSPWPRCPTSPAA